MTLARWIIAAAVLLVSPVAHAQEKGDAKAPDAAPAATPPVVRLLEPGAEPRKQLRYAPSPGSRLALTMTMKLGMQMEMDGAAKQPRVDMPPMIMVMNIAIAEVKPGGDIEYSAELVEADIGESDESASLPASAKETLRKAIKSIVGMSGEATVTDRGETKEASFHIPEGADAAMRESTDGILDSIKQLSVPLPEEAVGTGARWEVKMAVEGRVHLDQTVKVELLEVEGSKFRLSMRVDQSAPRQDMKISTPGAKAELLSLKSSGSGTVQGDTSSILPIVSAIKLSSKLRTKVVVGEEESMIRQGVDLDVSVRSGPVKQADPGPAKPK